MFFPGNLKKVDLIGQTLIVALIGQDSPGENNDSPVMAETD